MSSDRCIHLWNHLHNRDVGCFHVSPVAVITIILTLCSRWSMISPQIRFLRISCVLHTHPPPFLFSVSTQHSVYELHPRCYGYRYFHIAKWYFVINTQQFVYPFTCWWTVRLLQIFNLDEQSCDEHLSKSLCVNTYFISRGPTPTCAAARA